MSPLSAHRQLICAVWPRVGLAIFMICFLTPMAMADLARQHQAFERLILPGARAALLGGAYTALSADPSGLLYNPAGSAFSTDDQVTLNTWSSFKSQAVYEGAVRGQDFQENSLNRFGGFVGGLMDYSPFTLGYLIATPDKRTINQDDYFKNISTTSGDVKNFTRIHQETNSYDLYGVSVALAIGSSWGIGVFVSIYDRSIESMDYQQVEYNGGQVLAMESKVKVNNRGVMASGGIRYKGTNFSLGLASRTGQALSNKETANVNSVTHPEGSETPTINSITTDTLTLDADIVPLITRLGWAWYPTSYFLLSTEVNHSAEIESGNDSPNRKSTVNFALGLEAGPNSFKLMAGIFSNLSVFPRLSANEKNQPVHLDYYGHSAGIGILRKDFDLYLGLIRQDGQGEGQVIADSTEIQPVRAYLENYVISWNFKIQ